MAGKGSSKGSTKPMEPKAAASKGKSAIPMGKGGKGEKSAGGKMGCK